MQISLSQILIKRPEFLDLLSDMDEIYRFKTSEKMYEDLDKNLMTVNALDKKASILHRFKLYEELRIGVRYLIKEAGRV